MQPSNCIKLSDEQSLNAEFLITVVPFWKDKLWIVDPENALSSIVILFPLNDALTNDVVPLKVFCLIIIEFAIKSMFLNIESLSSTSP